MVRSTTPRTRSLPVNLSIHDCGGTIVRHADLGHRYCDRCAAFTYNAGALPTGTNPRLNRLAWEAGEDVSPDTGTAIYVCTNDHFTHHEEAFTSVAAFLAMCADVFGGAPLLAEQGDGYVDESGAVVLCRVSA
jgi:hypothetical protein